MAINSNIQWTDHTWNPVTGCTKVSQGCKNCYAERLYERFNGHGSFKKVLTHPERLQQPMKWKKPSMIFVNSMSDLFHDDVPWEFIYKVFEKMLLCPQHTFQVLTKMPERLASIIGAINFHLKRNYPEAIFPLPNVWLGVSVEDQKAADERIPLLLQVPAVVRFLSCEPLLGPIKFKPVVYDTFLGKLQTPLLFKDIHWVICGGKSGPGARPMHPEWARALRDQCEAANVPFFFKQWGEWIEADQLADDADGIIGKPSTHENANLFFKVGKKKAGNLLDGKQHINFPKTKNTA